MKIKKIPFDSTQKKKNFLQNFTNKKNLQKSIIINF